MFHKIETRTENALLQDMTKHTSEEGRTYKRTFLKFLAEIQIDMGKCAFLGSLGFALAKLLLRVLVDQ